MTIAIVGAGFVGEATGRGIAKHRHRPVFLDTLKDKVDSLRSMGFEAYQPEEYPEITTEVTMLCVPTPTYGQRIQLDHLRLACEQFAKRLALHHSYHTLVIRSTVPPGTTRDFVLPLVEQISHKKSGRDFGLAMQPEYLREKTANEDFERPWFILIGQLDERSGNVIEELYRPFDVPIERCDLEEAEIQKYIHNTFNAVEIAFFNEMRIALKAKGWNERKIFLSMAESCEGIWNPLYGLRDYGPFDGSCLPKDTRALLEWGDKNNFRFGILRAVIEENLHHQTIFGKNQQTRANYLTNIKL